jgi:hypothetical protein
LYEVIKTCVKPEEFEKVERYHRRLSEIVGKPVGLVKIKSKASKINMKDQFDSLYDVQQEYILSILDNEFSSEFSPKLTSSKKNSGKNSNASLSNSGSTGEINPYDHNPIEEQDIQLTD